MRMSYSNESILTNIELYGLEFVHHETKIPYESLRTMLKTSKKFGGFRQRGRKILYPEFDNELKCWIRQHRAIGRKVTAGRVLGYSRKIAKERGYTGINFSWGWLRRFLKRHRFSLRKPSSLSIKPLGTVLESVNIFIQEMKDLLKHPHYDPKYTLNVDETGLSTELDHSKTIDDVGAKNVKVKTTGKSKDNTTVILGGSMLGDKLPAFIILKGKGVKKLNISQPGNVVYGFREEGSWVDLKIMEKYVDKVLIPWSKKIPQGMRGLLILDNCKGHISKEIEDNLAKNFIDVKRIPPNTTGYVQPMDISVNASFKRKFAEHWDLYQFGLDDTKLTKRAGNYSKRRQSSMDFKSMVQCH